MEFLKSTFFPALIHISRLEMKEICLNCADSFPSSSKVFRSLLVLSVICNTFYRLTLLLSIFSVGTNVHSFCPWVRSSLFSQCLLQNTQFFKQNYIVSSVISVGTGMSVIHTSTISTFTIISKLISVIFLFIIPTAL